MNTVGQESREAFAEMNRILDEQGDGPAYRVAFDRWAALHIDPESDPQPWVNRWTGERVAGGRVLTVNDLDWVYSYNGTVLHHASFTPDQEAEMNDLCTAMGTYDCRPGLRRVSIPGFFSRTSMKRCDRCCDRNGLPRGIGSPKNDDECRRILGLDNDHYRNVIAAP